MRDKSCRHRESGCGQGNDQFNYLQDLDVNAAGNLYMADRDNCRIQKFNSRVYVITFCVTGACEDSFANIHSPVDVAIASLGQVYYTGWEDCIRVIDSSSKILTTLASGSNHHTSEPGF